MNRIGLGLAAAGFALAACLPPLARAQDAATTATPTPRIALMRNVTKSCAGDYEKYCPAPPQGSVAAGEDQVTCLKFHKNDLSLGCRHAINAAQSP